MMKAKDNLKGILMEAQESNIKYFALAYANGEIIINDMEVVEEKIKYIDNVYNEDLELKNAPHIKIVGYFCADSFEAIERALK